MPFHEEGGEARAGASAKWVEKQKPLDDDDEKNDL